MPRRILTHRTPQCGKLNECLEIAVVDEPGAGGASHEYRISNILPSFPDVTREAQRLKAHCVISFQNGPVETAGLNGISNEVLLAVLEDRLKGFEAGPYACRENAMALMHMQECLMWLQKRTRDRVCRGIEGTMEV